MKRLIAMVLILVAVNLFQVAAVSHDAGTAALQYADQPSIDDMPAPCPVNSACAKDGVICQINCAAHSAIEAPVFAGIPVRPSARLDLSPVSRQLGSTTPSVLERVPRTILI